MGHANAGAHEGRARWVRERADVRGSTAPSTRCRSGHRIGQGGLRSLRALQESVFGETALQRVFEVAFFRGEKQRILRQFLQKETEYYLDAFSRDCLLLRHGRTETQFVCSSTASSMRTSSCVSSGAARSAAICASLEVPVSGTIPSPRTKPNHAASSGQPCALATRRSGRLLKAFGLAVSVQNDW